MSTASIPSPLPFLPPLFNSESTELLTGSGEVLVDYILRWRHTPSLWNWEMGAKFASKASEKKFWPPPCLKFTSYWPLQLHGLLYLLGALSLLCGPFTSV